jgi:hypothetical protein
MLLHKSAALSPALWSAGLFNEVHWIDQTRSTDRHPGTLTPELFDTLVAPL